MSGTRHSPAESAELRRLRKLIDRLDRRIVGLLNERAELAKAVGHEKLRIGWRGVRDRAREKEVLLRVSMSNDGPMPQADILAIYRRLIASTRTLEARERDRARRLGVVRGPDTEPPA